MSAAMLLVHWRDIESRHLGWAKKKKMKKAKPPLCKTVGFELKRTKKKLVLIGTDCADEGSVLTVIPVGAIAGEWILETVAVRVKQ
jgi:hypothetical protein